MAYIIEVPNPFEPMVGVQKHEHAGGISILDWLQLTKPGFVEFEVATICVVNGDPILRKDWNRIIQPRDIVNFITLPQGIFAIIAVIIIAVIALSIVTAMSVPNATTPGAQPASDPVFSTKGQTNSIRLGEPIEVCYGRNRVYPSLAANPFFQYDANDQFQYSLYCLGQGEFEIEQLLIGDTPLSNYQEVEYEVITPGNNVTLFPTNVVTSIEAGGQTLFGPNEPEYSGDGFVGPFAANPTGTEIYEIQVDLDFPKGLFILNDEGAAIFISMEIQIQARLIDDAGAPLGGWVDLPDTMTGRYYIIAATTTPQRRTLKYPVANGRYEVRLRRYSDKFISARAGHDVIWDGLRGFIVEENPPDYENLTLIAVTIKATNNLNNRTQLAFNVVATRKLPIQTSSGYSDELVPTRSIVWAFVDVMKSVYGGRIFSDSFFDWDTLEELDALYESRNEHFDWVFRDPITVWEAAKAIARCGRGIPLLIGSLITLKRDGPQEVPVTMFTPENTIKGAFTWTVKLWELEEYDSVKIEYTEPLTGYKQENLLVTLPGGTTDNPQDVRIPGIQDRTHANREGLYMLASLRYLRENITIDTGLEGHIPVFGDLIAIAHDVPRWGQHGYVVNATRDSGDDYLIFVSEPLTWDESGDHVIVFRGKKSELVGPYPVIQTSDPQSVIVTIEDSEDFDFQLTGKTEPLLFIFGISGAVTKYAKVVKVEPQGGEVVRIVAVNDAPIIHTFDDLEPEPIEIPTLPLIPPDLPVVGLITLSQISGETLVLNASWPPAAGAGSYIVQSSTDGENWEGRGLVVSPNISFAVTPGLIYVRVAGVGTAAGPWSSSSITITDDPIVESLVSRLSFLPPDLKESAEDGVLVALNRPAGVDGTLYADAYLQWTRTDEDDGSTLLESTLSWPTVGDILGWHRVGDNWLIRVMFDGNLLLDEVEPMLDDSGAGPFYVVIGQRLYKSVGTPKDEHQALAMWFKVVDGGIRNHIDDTIIEIEVEGGQFSGPDFLLEGETDDAIYPTSKVYFGKLSDFIVHPSDDIYFERAGGNSIDDASNVRFIKTPVNNMAFAEVLADVPSSNFAKDDPTMCPDGTLSELWGDRVNTYYELYDEQVGNIFSGDAAPFYGQVEAVDEALGAILDGTATAEQIYLAEHFDNVLGAVTGGTQTYYSEL